MMQGDEYRIPVQIVMDDIIATADDVTDIEICLGKQIRKTMRSGEITYNAEKKVFLFPIKQEETFLFEGYGSGHTEEEMQVRVKTTGGDIVGVSLGYIDVIDAISKEVI